MKSTVTTMAEITKRNYEESVEFAKKMANCKYGYDIKESKKNILKLYSIPATMTLATISMAGIAHFDPSVIATIGTTVTFGGTIISAMCVSKQIKQENINLERLNKEYDDYICENIYMEKPTKKDLDKIKDEYVQSGVELSQGITIQKDNVKIKKL